MFWLRVASQRTMQEHHKPDAGDEAIRTDTAEEAEEQENVLLRKKRRCAKCNTAMDAYLIDENRKIHVCGNNPDCDGFEVEEVSLR